MQLRREGIDIDLDHLETLLGMAIESYKAERELSSTDTMPTTASLRSGATDIGAQLGAVVSRLADEPHLGIWLGHYLGEQLEVEAAEAYKAFVEPLKERMVAARAAADAFERQEPMTVAFGDSSERDHRRKTRTDARDRALIPGIVSMLRVIGLQLRDEQVGAWDHDAIAVACNAVELVLGDLKIDVPARGDTAASLGGDANEGRLVKAVKRAWTNSETSAAR